FSEVFDDRLKARRALVAERRASLHEALPECGRIERLIGEVGSEACRRLADGTMTDEEAASFASGAKARIMALADEGARHMEAAGYPPDYLDPPYACPTCRDTGYVSASGRGVKCVCHRRMQMEEIFKDSGLGVFAERGFESFDLSVYSDSVSQERYGITASPRANARLILDGCVSFMEGFGDRARKNLLFTGGTGTGKTFMCGCIAHAALAAGYGVVYQTAPRMFDIISEHKAQAYRQETRGDDSAPNAYGEVLGCNLLIVDDLGTEAPSAARYAELLNILNARRMNGFSYPCKTVISTNLELRKLKEYYDERVWSRIVGDFALFLFAGDDLRVAGRGRSPRAVT
ncbi:MAG: ATP-binding protein, partial [Oscillospiraceae bacterium]|nr:ATP-binding protein [Oscillospiraceae bacterium]